MGKHIIWDWNGTLLDDTQLCVEVLNGILAIREREPISIEDYRQHFRFPVIEFYNYLGFDTAADSFAAISREFIDAYEARWFSVCQLHEGATSILSAVRSYGGHQSVLSAAKQDALEVGIREYQIGEYFTELAGTSNIYADGKIARGKQWIAEADLDSAEVLLVGDTLHDKEVADAMGVGCLLVAHGHYTRQRLAKSGAPVFVGFDDLGACLERFFEV